MFNETSQKPRTTRLQWILFTGVVVIVLIAMFAIGDLTYSLLY